MVARGRRTACLTQPAIGNLGDVTQPIITLPNNNNVGTQPTVAATQQQPIRSRLSDATPPIIASAPISNETPLRSLHSVGSVEEIFDLSVLKTNKLFSSSLLSQWDYPIFDLAAQFPTSILSMVCLCVISHAIRYFCLIIIAWFVAQDVLARMLNTSLQPYCT